tara:strand:+ start:230 stop:1417 length:1188 start_codon:yes stop_codon:yes gene_type:complete
MDLLGVSLRTIYRWDKGETVPKRAVIEYLEQMININLQKQKDEQFTFIDLFAGIGGLRKGFESIGGKCIFTSEWDKYAQITYKANFPGEHEIAGDIKKIGVEDIPRHNLLLAGFPCQPFSIAGVSKKNSLQRSHGFRCNAQGTLFFDVARIIEYHQPNAFLLENVKNLVSHDKGNTFKVIYKTLTEELGYQVDFRVINGKSVVPQNRERIYIVGFKNKNNFDFNKIDLPDIQNGPKLNSILHNLGEMEQIEERFASVDLTEVSEKYTLSNKLWSYLQNYAEKHRAKGNGFGFGLFDENDVARTLSARYYKDGSEILIKQNNKNPRRLTPRECSRLMGFDMANKSDFKIPVSDTQAYKQFGNSVVVPVIEKIAELMKPHIIQSLKLPISNIDKLAA